MAQRLNSKPKAQKKAAKKPKTPKAKVAAVAAAASAASSNSRVRRDVIRRVCKELAILDAESDAVAAKKRELLQSEIKGKLDMPIANFRAAYRLYCLEAEQRDIFFDVLAETFQSLNRGDQLDFLPALRKEMAGEDDEEIDHEDETGEGDQPAPSRSSELSIARAKKQGDDDGSKGKTANNAWPDGSPEALAYAGGYHDAQAKIAGTLGSKH